MDTNEWEARADRGDGAFAIAVALLQLTRAVHLVRQPRYVVRRDPGEAVLEAGRVQEWLERCCDGSDPHVFTGSTELFNSWRRYAEAAGIQAGSRMALVNSIEAAGFTRDRTADARGFVGIRLRDDG